MKILACNPNGGAFLYILRGYKNAFNAIGSQWEHWDGTPQHIQRYKPDLYLGCSGWRQDIPQSLRKALNIKIAIHVNPFGTKKVGAHGGPVIDEPEGAIQWTLRQQPDGLFCYGDQVCVNTYWDKWTKVHGLKVQPMMNAGDSIYFYPQYNESLKADCGYIGGYWPYKSININKFLKPVAQSLNCRVHGWSAFPHEYKARGAINEPLDRQLFSSIKVAPCISESHTTATGIDIPERIFKVSLCGALAVSDPVNGMNRNFSNEALVMATDPKDYLEKCRYYIQNEEERKKVALKQREEILSKHTYLHRIGGLLSMLGFKNESEQAFKKADEIKTAQLTNAI